MEASAGLVGRDRECLFIDRLLHHARSGRARSLVLRGDPGIGKTALLEYAADRAQDMLVLQAAGVEIESDLPFAGLYGLLRPVVDRLEQLPEMQAHALGGALALAPSAETDRLLVSAAVLGVLAAAAEEGPVLCLIDDVQWLDKPSVDALVFAARRVRAEPLAMLFALREGEGERFDAAGLEELPITALDELSAGELLTRQDAIVSPSVRARLLAEAHGNPLALLELPASLSAEERAGRSPLLAGIALTPRLQGLFARRIERLPEPTPTALLVAAAEDTGDLATVLRACAELALGPDALDPAERANLIRIAGGTITFRHPLVRRALYQGATASARRRSHSALASVLAGEEHADRRVWHQAMAAVGGDEEVAAALEASARRAQLRGAHASAAKAYLRAAELSVDEDRTVQRTGAAAQASWDAGQPEVAQQALDRALATAKGELRARLLYLRGVIEARATNPRAAPATLLEAVAATDYAQLQLEVLHEAAEAATYIGDLALVGEISRRESVLPATTDRDRFLVAIGAGWLAALSGDHGAADAAFNDALRRADSLEDPRALVWAGNAASVARGLGAGLPYCTRAVDLARRQGLLSLLPMALHRQAQELLWNSRFDAAYAAAQEGRRMSIDLGYGAGGHLANLAAVEAAWGRYDEAREHAESALAIGQQSGFSLLTDSADFTLGFVELAAGRVEEARERLLALTALDRPGAHFAVALNAIPDLVEAAVRAGRLDLVSERLSQYRQWVTSAPTGSGRALLARCEALLAERPPEEAFREALDLAPALPSFQRARTELLYGEWLRRERRRQEARAHLRAATQLFRSLGAVPWEERAEAELRATGETARRRDPSTLDQLTPQELQIAGLVAEGLTNREIAAQLFLSPRTIDYHLRKVFSKLGIASRTDLVRRGLPSREPA